MAKIVIPPISPPPQGAPQDTIDLHQRVVGAVRSLANQINNNPFTKNPATDTLDMNHNRVQNVSPPVNDGDAVNLGFLKRAFKSGQQGQQSQGGGGLQHYEIVFYNSSDMALGTQAQYNVGINRTGSPIEANISALTPPTGATLKVNFKVNGGANILSSDLVLGTGITTCVFASNFTAGVKFNLHDIVTIVVNQVGSSAPGSRVSVGLVVKRS